MGSSTVRQEFGTDLGLVHEFVITGRKAGADRDFYAKLAHDEALFGQVVALVKEGKTPTKQRRSRKQSTAISLDQAKEIMGSNFYGPPLVEEELFGIQCDYQPVPFTAEVLDSCRDTHLLQAIAPMSLMDIWHAKSGLFYSKNDPWYGRAEQKFARVKAEPDWQLVRKNELPGSTSKTWSQQQQLLTNDEYVPSVEVAAQAAILHFAVTGERLFSNVWVRTNSVSADGHRVFLSFDPDGLYVGNGWDDDAGSRLGVAVARKSN